MKDKNSSQGTQSPEKAKRKPLYYIIIAACALVLAAAITFTVVMVTRDNAVTIENPDPDEGKDPDDGKDESEDPDGGDEPTGGEVVFTMPLDGATVSATYSFWYNSTLDRYNLHEGIDFKAEEGASVCAIADGTVESVYVEDVLRGGQITIVHEDGVKSVYSFVTAESGLKAGDKVEQGDVIATVSEANGEEYKDGAHLHLEIYADGELVDPEAYLPFEEK